MGWRRGQAYSQDLRDRVLEARDQGMSCRQVAARFEVSPSYVVKAAARRDRTGQRTAGGRGRPPRKLAGREAALSAYLVEKPDATLADLRRWLGERHGVSVGLKTIWTALRERRFTLKKSPARGRAAAA